MGTSASSKGGGPRSPMVPPWADASPQMGLPEPVPRRHFDFRHNYKKSIESGSPDDARRALRGFARGSLGGASVGTRRFGSIADAGSALYGAFSELADGGTGAEYAGGRDLSKLSGQPIEVAIDAIADALTPSNGDRDKIHSSLKCALLNGLQQAGPTFDTADITADLILATLEAYLVEAVFLETQWVLGDAAQVSADAIRKACIAETNLHELIRADVSIAVQKHTTAGEGLTARSAKQLQLRIINQVLSDWEGSK